MNRPLMKKYIAEGLLLFVGLALGVFAFCWFRVWIVGELDTAQFRQIIDLLPKDWRKFATVDFDWLVSYLGRTSLTLNEPMLISLICAWGLVRGSDVVSGELSRGTMELLLAQPVSRRKIYLQHAWLTLVMMFVLILVCWLGMALGIWTTNVEETTYPSIQIPFLDYAIPLSFLPPRTTVVAMSSEVNPLLFFPGIFNLFCLGFCMSGFAAFCSSLDRYRWRTLGVVAAFYFCNAGIRMLGMGSEKYSWAKHCGLFGLYHPAAVIKQTDANTANYYAILRYDPDGTLAGLAFLPNCLLLIFIGVCFYWIGLMIFQKRDIPAPM